MRTGRPSAFDRLPAARLGVSVVERLLAGKREVVVGMHRQAVVATPLAGVCSKRRRVELDDYRMSRMLAK